MPKKKKGKKDKVKVEIPPPEDPLGKISEEETKYYQEYFKI